MDEEETMSEEFAEWVGQKTAIITLTFQDAAQIALDFNRKGAIEAALFNRIDTLEISKKMADQLEEQLLIFKKEWENGDRS